MCDIVCASVNLYTVIIDISSHTRQSMFVVENLNLIFEMC